MAKKKHNKNKKVLNGIDLINNNKNSEEETNLDLKQDTTKKSNYNINEKIQSFISILFTIIIFSALILLVITLYKNNSNNSNSYDEKKLCEEYIKKDYNIDKDEVINFIKVNRGIFYNLNDFKNTNNYLNKFITYYIWSLDSEYLECDDDNCLSTKKEILKENLKVAINNYLGKTIDVFEFPDNFTDDDKMRLYQSDDKVILTFKEFSYQSYKHDFIDVLIDEDNIRVILALSELKDNNYTYIGYKNIYLKYKNNKFIIDSIETTLN